MCSSTGPTAEGGVCSDHGDCEPLTYCIDLFDEGTSYCLGLCTAVSDGLSCREESQACAPLFENLDAGLCIGDDCTPPETGCDDGERCAPFMGEVLACLPAGTVPVGGDCSEDFCVPGASCVEEWPYGYICRSLCQSSSDCDVSAPRCLFIWDGVLDWGICQDGCDPVTQLGCDSDLACYYSDPEVGSTICWEAGDLLEGADCSSMIELCEPGLDCFLEPDTDPFEYYCRAYCDIDHPCETGTCQTTPYMLGMRICLD